MKKIWIIIGGVLLLAFSFVATGQRHESYDNDSLLKTIRKEYLYDNPQKVIDIAGEVLRSSTKKTVRFKAAILISTAFSSERDYMNALENALNAEDIAEKTNNNPFKAQIYNKLGEIYYQLKVYDKAIEYLDRAEKLSTGNEGNEKLQYQLASNYIVKGFIYKDKLNCEIAIGFFNKGIQEYLEISDLNYTGNISIAAYNKGNCYILLQNYPKAISSYRYAHSIADSIGANSLSAFAQKGLANVYMLQGDYKMAIKLLREAHEISKDVGDLVLDREIYRGLSKNYLALKDRPNFKKYNALYLDYKLKVRNSERKSINNAINRIKTQKKNNIQEVRRKFYLQLKMVIALGILLIFGTIFLLRRQNKAIYTLKKTIKSTSEGRKAQKA